MVNEIAGFDLLEPVVEIAPASPPAASTPGRPALLGGVDWEGVAGEARGMFALVEVDPGEGERQAWARRGDA